MSNTPAQADIDAEAAKEGVPKGQVTPALRAALDLNLIAEKIADAIAAAPPPGEINVTVVIPPELANTSTGAFATELLGYQKRVADDNDQFLLLQKPAA
jgi:hypothetical protein